MFELIRNTPMGEDCSVGYCVNLDKEYTLQEFIDTVLAIKDKWGNIKIVKRGCAWYNYPTIRYRYGEITIEPNLPEKVYSYKVKSVSARGDWSTMDYIVTLEKEVE